MLDRGKRPIERNTSCIAGACPIIDAMPSDVSAAGPSPAPLRRAALRTSSTASSISNGFGRYSKAPPL